MRFPRKQRLKIIADVDDDVQTRVALRVVQPRAPQPRGNPVLPFIFLFFCLCWLNNFLLPLP